MNKIEKGIESNMVYLQIKEVLENEVKKVLREYDKKMKLKGIENDNYE